MWIALIGWIAHLLIYWLWLLIDHDSALKWMWMWGFGVFTHCFDETGIMSHVPEGTSIAVPTGFVFGLIGMLAAVIALLRARAGVRRALCVLRLGANIAIAIPGCIALIAHLLYIWS